MHVKESAQADVPASARPDDDDDERRTFSPSFSGTSTAPTRSTSGPLGARWSRSLSETPPEMSERFAERREWENEPNRLIVEVRELKDEVALCPC
jgi:hypothetical protein